MNYFQTKSFDATVKDLDIKSGVVTGYFASFSSTPDAHGDVIKRGAFAKSVKENGPTSSKARQYHLYQHDTNLILSKPKTLIEDDFGLYFESEIVKTSYGEDVLKLYEAGVISEHSIGFKTINESYTGSYNEIKEVMLFEGSTVTWGANENTPFQGFKSLTAEQSIEKISKLETAIRKGTFTDETFHLLIIQLKQLQQAFYDLENSLKSTTQPETTTEAEIKPDIEDQEAKNVQAFVNQLALKYAQ